MSIVLVTALLLAPPGGCSRARVTEAFNAGKFAQAEKIALGCASNDEPNYYFYAAQAQGELRHWRDQLKSLKTFLKLADASDPNRSEALQMLKECEKKLKPPKDKTQPPPDKETLQDTGTSPPVGGAPSTGGNPPTGTGDTSDGAGGGGSQTQEPQPRGPELETKDIEPSKPDDRPAPTPSQRDPRRRGLWIGVGVVAGTSVLAGGATGLAGYIGGTKPASEKNDGLLEELGLPAQWNPAEGSPEQTAKAEELQTTYPANTYYRDLLGGLRRESVGTVVAAGGVGLVLGTLPELARSERGRRAGFVALLTGGALMVAGGAIWMSSVHKAIDTSLGGYDEETNPDGWRAGGPAYDEKRRNYLLSAGLAGLGLGLVVGGTTGALVRWRDRPAEGRASLRVVPTLRGLVLTGRF